MAKLEKQHLKKRGGRWYLKLAIPRAIRHLYPSSSGTPRTHIEERLGTADLAEANRIKHRHIARWYADFEDKRRRAAGILPPEVAEARTYRDALREVDDEDVRDATLDAARDRAIAIEETAGTARAEQFFELATVRTSLRDAWGEWMEENEHNAATKQKDEQAFRGLMDFLGVADAAPTKITGQIAREYVRWLNTEAKSVRGGPLAKATKEGRIAPLRIFWTHYLEHNELVPLGMNPWRAPKITGRRKSYEEQPDKRWPYTDKEILALLNGPDLKQSKTLRYSRRTLLELYALCFYTGARLGEIANRRVGDIEAIKGGYLLHIRTGKTDESPRAIPILHPIPVQVLKRRLGGRTEARAQLFAEFIPGGKMGSLAWYPSKALGRYRDKVGLGTATDTHSTRHQFITDLTGRGVPLVLVQQYVGHKPPGITAGTYARPTNEGMRTVARAVKFSRLVETALRNALDLH